MRFSIKVSVLIDALSRISGAIDKKTALPILFGVHITADDSHTITITSTDLYIHVRMRVEGGVFVPGAAVFRHAQLLNVLKQIGRKNSVVLELAEGAGRLFVGEQVIVLETFPADDFPSIPEVADNPVLTALTDDFIDALRTVSYAASRSDDESPGRHRITVSSSDGHAFLLGAEVHRAARVGLANTQPDGACSFSFRVAETVQKAFSKIDKGSRLRLTVDDRWVEFSACGVTVVASKLDEFSKNIIDAHRRFFERIENGTGSAVTEVSRSAFLNALKLLASTSTLPRGATKIARLHIDSSGLSVSDPRSTAAPFTMPGLPFGSAEACYNANYVIQALQASRAEFVRVVLCLIEAPTDSEDPNDVSDVDTRKSVLALLPSGEEGSSHTIAPICL